MAPTSPIGEVAISTNSPGQNDEGMVLLVPLIRLPWLSKAMAFTPAIGVPNPVDELPTTAALAVPDEPYTFINAAICPVGLVAAESVPVPEVGSRFVPI